MPGYNLGRAQGLVDIDTRGLKEADISLREAGRGLLYTGTALLGGFGYVVKVAADFEKQMDFVQAITQATGDEMAKLNEVAIELGKQGPYGPREVAGAFVELAKAGVETQAIIDGVGAAAVSLAASADIGLVESTEILVNTLKTFNLGAEDAVHVVDQIAGAANASTIDVDDFAYSLRYAGSIAAAVQIPLEDVATALAILGDRGIKGSTGGTSLRRILLNLQPASAKAADALKELGIITEDGTNQFFTAEGSAKSLAEVFQLLNEATAGLTDAQKLSAFNTIFGARAAPSALILADQAAEGFTAYSDAIERTTAADVAAARLDNLAGAVTRLKAAIEATFIQSGTPFQKTLQDFAEAARVAVLWFGKLPGPVQRFIVGGVAVLGILSLLAGGFLLTVGNIVRAIRVFGQLAGLMQAFGSGGGAAANAAGSVGLLSRALGFFLSPAGLVVLAIIAIVGAFIYFYKTSEGFRNFINGIGTKIKEVFLDVVNFFKGPFVDGIRTAWEKVTGFFSDIGGFFSSIGSTIGGAASNVGGFFASIGSSIGSIGSGAFNSVTGFFSTLGNLDLGSAFSKALGLVLQFTKDLPGKLSKAASKAVSAFTSFISELPGKLGYALGFAIGRAIRWGFELNKWIAKTGVKVVTTVVEWGGKLVSKLIEIFGKILVEVALWAASMGQKALEMGINFLTNVVTWLSQLPGKIAEFLLQTLMKMIELVPVLVSQGFELGWGFLTKVVEFMTQLPGKIAEFLWDAINTVIGLVPDILSAASEFGQNIWDGIIDIITGIPGKVVEILTDAIGGIAGLVGDAWQAAWDFGNGLWQGFKDGVGINSPSYIERALFNVEDQAALTAQHLNRSIGYINQRASRLPDLTSGGMPVAAMVSAGRFTQSGGAGIDSRGSQAIVEHHYHAPLLGEATIRDDRDIYELANDLELEQSRKNRGKGVKSGG